MMLDSRSYPPAMCGRGDDCGVGGSFERGEDDDSYVQPNRVFEVIIAGCPEMASSGLREEVPSFKLMIDPPADFRQAEELSVEVSEPHERFILLVCHGWSTVRIAKKLMTGEGHAFVACRKIKKALLG